MSKYTRSQDDYSANISYADSSLSASQYTFGQHGEDVDASMEYAPNMMHPHGGESFDSVEGRLSPLGSPRNRNSRSKRLIQFLFLIASTAMIFLIVFFISIGIMDRIFKNERLDPNETSTNVGSPSTTVALPSPTLGPMSEPTLKASESPTIVQSFSPSLNSSSKPSNELSVKPSTKPSAKPTNEPSDEPSPSPSAARSARPSPFMNSMHPTITSSTKPSTKNSFEPSLFFTNTPSIHQSIKPSAVASQSPTEPIIPVPTRTLFTVVGGSIDEDELTEELSDQPKEADFLVHLGNFVEPNQCQSSTYSDFRSFLRTSNLNIPVFLLPGIQDLQTECVDGALANITPLQYWNGFFHDINTLWDNNKFDFVERGSKSSENLSAAFSIYHNQILFIGLNILRENDWSDGEYQNHLNLNLNWIQNQARNPRVQGRGIRSWVFYGNDVFHEGNKSFFDGIVQEIEAFGDVPALYLFEGDGVDSDFPVGNDLLFVSVERASAPFMTVAVKTDGGQFAFQFILQ